MSLQEEITGIKLFDAFDIGPISIYLFSIIILVVCITALKYFFLWLLTKGRSYIIFRETRGIYDKYTMIVVFVTFFVLSFLAKFLDVPLDDPVTMIIALVFVLIFIGWTLISDIRALQILLIALIGSFVGYIII